MPWDVIDRRIAGATTKPASISFHCVVRKGVAVSRPICQVTFRYAIATQLDWQASDPVGVVIGSGEHSGLIRIIRNSENKIGKCRILKRGGISFNLGHIPHFGLEARDKRATDAKIIDPDTVEVVIPDWSARAEKPEEPDEEEDDAPASLKPPPQVVANGVTVVFEDENEHVSFGGQVMEVTSRQAKFISIIARVMPEPCGRSEIIKRMWGDQPPSRVDAVLDQVATDLINALQPIGLTVSRYKGVGFALRKTKIEAAAA